jgi:hypothetical protein
MKNLSKEEAATLDAVAMQTEKSLQELEQAQATAIRKVVPEGVSEETVVMLKSKPELMEALSKNPRAAKAMTLCNSPCIPEFATASQVERIEGIIARAEARGIELNQRRLKEYLHRAGDHVDLNAAIDDLEAAFRKAQPVPASAAGSTVPIEDAVMDEAELLQHPDIRSKGAKPLDVRLGEARAGNDFDLIEGQKYPHNQVPIKDKAGKYRRLDSYDPGRKEIISRKSLSAHSGQIAYVDEFTMIDYLQEFALKYPYGATIADVPSARSLANKTLTGSYVLEVPPQEWIIPERILKEAKARGVTIRDINGRVYH